MIRATIRDYRAEFGTASLATEALIIPALVVAFVFAGVIFA